MSRRRRGRALNGVLLLDKPQGMSSNFVLQKAKRLFGAAKAGHTGALDPLATGMLPICFGEATKFSQFLLEADKRYHVTARLGVRTTTSDADGDIVAERPVPSLSESQLEAYLDQFRGELQQVPSMYSALKYQGQPLYKYARAGQTVPRVARDISVYSNILLHISGDTLELSIHCSKGTYIRTIIDDLGELIGCGAHVTQLRRTHVADYPIEQMVTLEQIEAWLPSDDQMPSCFDRLDACLLPMETTVAALVTVEVPRGEVPYVQQGQAVQVSHAPTTGWLRLIEADTHTFLGIGHVNDDGLVAPKRLVVHAEL
jgi:tRNA pseudouridine55 synthase